MYHKYTHGSRVLIAPRRIHADPTVHHSHGGREASLTRILRVHVRKELRNYGGAAVV
jgi:hypothetical protein